ncbi:MAG: hypothetical protein KatS3mg036_1167 [Ignavibacterium sp.]|nr:MAG: hypothetical protein KatS3mg036_1167 [Ignavibacterium sp.]
MVLELSKADDIINLNHRFQELFFYWAVSKKFDELETHNIIFSDDYKTEFDQLTKQRPIA